MLDFQCSMESDLERVYINPDQNVLDLLQVFASIYPNFQAIEVLEPRRHGLNVTQNTVQKTHTHTQTHPQTHRCVRVCARVFCACVMLRGRPVLQVAARRPGGGVRNRLLPDMASRESSVPNKTINSLRLVWHASKGDVCQRHRPGSCMVC